MSGTDTYSVLVVSYFSFDRDARTLKWLTVYRTSRDNEAFPPPPHSCMGKWRTHTHTHTHTYCMGKYRTHRCTHTHNNEHCPTWGSDVRTHVYQRVSKYYTSTLFACTHKHRHHNTGKWHRHVPSAFTCTHAHMHTRTISKSSSTEGRLKRWQRRRWRIQFLLPSVSTEQDFITDRKFRPNQFHADD